MVNNVFNIRLSHCEKQIVLVLLQKYCQNIDRPPLPPIFYSPIVCLFSHPRFLVHGHWMCCRERMDNIIELVVERTCGCWVFRLRFDDLEWRETSSTVVVEGPVFRRPRTVPLRCEQPPHGRTVVGRGEGGVGSAPGRVEGARPSRFCVRSHFPPKMDQFRFLRSFSYNQNVSLVSSK